MIKTQAPHTKPLPAPGKYAPARAGELAVVVGAGTSGTAAARLLATLGCRVRLIEKNPENISPAFRPLAESLGITIATGEHHPAQFAGAAVIVASPGAPVAMLRSYLEETGNPPLISEMELALRYTVEPILAVTGTSGKTTTVSMAAAMLGAAGKNVFLGGNIGTPLSEYVLQGEKADVLVLEASSFQLQLTSSLRPKAAVLLNLAANHLDHHRDMEEYTDAKFRIFALQQASDLALLPEELFASYQRRGFKATPTLIRPGACFSGLQLKGRHNALNTGAAYLACAAFGVSEQCAQKAAAGFTPLRHRLENAGTADGVLYINDSKSTTVDALRVALASFKAPVLLLAGGRFKGGDLESLRDLLRQKVRAIALFGASREIFETAWRDSAPLTWDADLPSAMNRLRALARPGEVVLLSPATSSFDLYSDYKARGDHFCSLAKNFAHSPQSG